MTNVNDAPTGAVTISGTAQENQVLTASNTLADADGLGAISYQWQRDGVNVVGATAATYTLGDADVGHAITWWQATPTAMARGEHGQCGDGSGGQRQRRADRRGDDQRHGDRGPDADGVEHAGGCRRPGRFSYQWQRDGVNIAGRPAATYTLGDADVGHAIRGGELHRRPRHAGERGQCGDRRGGQRQRRADRHGDDQRHGDEEPDADGANTLADADGLGAISYQWQRDGVNMAGATGATYTLGDADVGHAISVVAATPTATARRRAWPVRRRQRWPTSTMRRPAR